MKYAYMIERFINTDENSRVILLGIYSSLTRARDALRSFPRKHQYTIYRLPMNAVLTRGRDTRDVLGEYDHWHYGTYQGIEEQIDDEGNVLRQREYRETIWP
jgi:hypothetical protein